MSVFLPNTVHNSLYLIKSKNKKMKIKNDNVIEVLKKSNQFPESNSMNSFNSML